jgi:hypothetical protein
VSFLIICVPFSLPPVAFAPPEIPGMSLLEQIERINYQPTEIPRFDDFHEPCPLRGPVEELPLDAGPLAGITTRMSAKSTAPSQQVRGRYLRAFGIVTLQCVFP